MKSSILFGFLFCLFQLTAQRPDLIMPGLETPAQELLPLSSSSLLARAHFTQGRNYLHLFDYEQAADELFKALQADSTHVMAYSYLAWAYFSLEQNPQYALSLARNHYQSAGEDEISFSQTIEQFLTYQTEDALGNLEAMINKYPGDPYLRHLQWWIRQKKREAAAADSSMTLMLDRFPDFAPAQYSAGLSALEKGEAQAAKGHFEKLEKLRPGQPVTFDALGQWHLQQGAYETAVDYFIRARERSAPGVVRQERLGDACFLAGRMPEAVEAYGRARRQMKWHPSYYTYFLRQKQAFAQLGNRDFDNAASILREMANEFWRQNDPASQLEMLRTISWVHWLEGDTAEVRKTLIEQENVRTYADIELFDNKHAKGYVKFFEGLLALYSSDTARAQANAGIIESLIRPYYEYDEMPMLANFLKGEIAIAQEKWRQAIFHLEKLMNKGPFFTHRLAGIYQQLSEPEKYLSIMKRVENYRVVDFSLAAYQVVRNR